MSEIPSLTDMLLGLVMGQGPSFPETPSRKLGYVHTIRLIQPPLSRFGDSYLEDKDFSTLVTEQVNSALEELIMGEHGVGRWYKDVQLVGYTHSVSERRDGTIAVFAGLTFSNAGRLDAPGISSLGAETAVVGEYGPR